MLFRVIYFLIFFNISWCQYDLINVYPGTRMSVNDDMFVSASNAFYNFAVLLYPFRNTTDGGSILCNMRYNTTDRFVHSVAVIGIAKNSSTNSEEFMFIFAAEKISTMSPYVCIGIITKSTCSYSYSCTDMGITGSHQEYFLIGVDTNGTFAYGFTSLFVFKLDIYANKIILNLTTDSVWPSQGFIPHAMDIADTWGVVAGYGYADENRHNYGTLGCLIDLSTLVNASCISVTNESTFLIPSNVVSYNDLYELSVAIRGNKILIGILRLSSVVILQNYGSSLTINRMHILSFLSSNSVCRVVDWADDTTIAILVQDPFETSWSTTQIFFYRENSVTLTSPIFTFPNNQQIIGSRLSRPSFARFSITIKGNMAILTDKADILIIPLASAGYTSSWIYNIERTYVFYFQPKLCIGGTYKNHSSLGPCQICPTNTRNPGTFSYEITQCILCSKNSSNSFCPLASLADITNLTTISSYSQAVAYPETADTTDIEDILLKNVFQIGNDPHCLLISPVLWTIIASALCFLFILFIVTIDLCGYEPCIKYSKTMKKIFKHTDIIGEGKMWIGGLTTLAIIVLVSFSYWFSASFIRRYPIENIFQSAKFSCDLSLVNAQFSTGLVLLAIPKSESAQPIFDLLDKQIFNLTVELINTGFTCNSITAQENLISSKYVPLIIDCQETITTATTSVTFSLPRHLTTIQINISGPYWIGAIRLCIRGHGQISGSNTLRELDFCESYSTPNQAISRYTYIPIVFVKNINMTQSLNPTDPVLYSGIWMPTFTTVPLSDEEYYVKFGNYLRYTSSSTILQIMLDERPFYIKNIQQPIVRTAELIFHSLLFTSLCIELFAFSFLFIKLLIKPICQSIGYLTKKIYHRIFLFNDLHSSNTNDSISKIKTHLKGSIESDSFIYENNQRKNSNTCLTSQTELNSIETISKL
ncbi:unnamed protein product [Adineta steineri]|uniref:Uncharacterized protein n=1 Tax=Adineta steineri TaxID=433720 RepID=A0A813XLM3_9BILA|nr:unnamed protein product [Adineta steineri]